MLSGLILKLLFRFLMPRGLWWSSLQYCIMRNWTKYPSKMKLIQILYIKIQTVITEEQLKNNLFPALIILKFERHNTLDILIIRLRFFKIRLIAIWLLLIFWLTYVLHRWNFGDTVFINYVAYYFKFGVGSTNVTMRIISEPGIDLPNQ